MLELKCIYSRYMHNDGADYSVICQLLSSHNNLESKDNTYGVTATGVVTETAHILYCPKYPIVEMVLFTREGIRYQIFPQCLVAVRALYQHWK